MADRGAAVSAMYALSLFGLITIAGVGWDYARLMTMDSELQNAADQAALAAATQLTGTPGARANAEAAANNFFANAASEWVNETKLANDGEGRPIVGLNFEFYQTWDSTTDTPGALADSDANARYVRVSVDGREAFYALTAVGGVLSSGLIGAEAVATLEAAACNVPPLMICAPLDDPGFPGAEDVGIALDLRERPQSTELFAPGNFDLLQIDYENVAPSDNNRTLGLNSDFLGCTSSQVTTRPGSRTPETNAINTRFGIYPNGNNFACQADGDFCPAEVTRSDLVRRVTVNNQFDAATCANTTGGDLIPFSDVPRTPPVPKQGFPLDTCQTLGAAGCASFGDGLWDIDSYMNNIHGTTPASVPDLDTNEDGKLTRFDVYNWERMNPARRTQAELARVPNTNGNGGTLYCSAPTPIAGTPVVPSDFQKDRRVVTVAVVDCADSGGRFDVNTFRYVDLFLLGPTTTNSAGESELRAELIGLARRADGGSGFQTFGRKKPVLVR